MKHIIGKIFFILTFLIIFFIKNLSFSKEQKITYSQTHISDYLSGIVSAELGHINEAFDYLNKVQLLKKEHPNYNVQFIRTLILLGKFKQAFSFSKSIQEEGKDIFEVNLLLGLNSFINKDYISAEKSFNKLNEITPGNIFFEDFVANILIAWSKAANKNNIESFKFVEKVPQAYRHLKQTQISFLQCYFNMDGAQKSLEELAEGSEYNFSRYNFFLANYLLHKNEDQSAEAVIKNSRKKYNSNLLLKQAEIFFINKSKNKIKNIFNCKNPKDPLSEFFYVIANLYSGQDEYQLSNFYLKISLYLNEKFLPNKALLAENLYYLNKEEESKKIFNSIKSIGSVYSWHASKNIASILIKQKGKKYSVNKLKKDFSLLSKPTFQHYYELGNFYKENEYFKESIKYYSLALKKIKKDHSLVYKILDRRGTSYERIGDWDNAEKDLLASLAIKPDQAHVLNYLAYSWVDRGINLDKGLVMLKKADKLKENDGYIIDSLGWAYFAKKNYIKAERFLEKAVQLLPSDPIINDHYADSLWMLNKSIQARYVWNYVLKLDSTEKELKDSIGKKLIFGISNEL